MSLNLHHLALFQAVAEEQSVSRASERLMVSQPAVSKQLKQLERAVGVALFDRTPRGVRATQAGELLSGYARRIFGLAKEAEQALGELRGLRRGSLCVAAGTTIGVYLLPDVFVRFRQSHPGVRISLEIDGSEGVRQRLLEGTVDLGLTEGDPGDQTLDARVLMEDELIAVAPPGHPLARRRKVTAAEVCREPLVLRETGSAIKSLAERALADRGLPVRPAMSLGSTEAIKRAVAAGVGLAVVSRLAVELELRAGILAEVKVTALTLRRPLRLLQGRGRHRSHAASAFVQLLEECVRGRSRRRK